MTRPRTEAQPHFSTPVALMTATVVIPSHNRCDDLALTCRRISELAPTPERVIVSLDGCTDGSLAMLRRDFPGFHVVENPMKAGSIAARDKAFRSVTSDLIISLDDDSYPLCTDFISQISEVFRAHPEAGVVTFVEIRNDGRPVRSVRSSEAPGYYVSTYAGCAAVIRRTVYGAIASYRPGLWHNYEEPDFCVQCYGAGYAVWFEPSISIRHHFTPMQRNLHHTHILNARNELLSVFTWCPLPQLVAVASYRIARQFVHACTQGLSWVAREPVWWWAALRMMPWALRERRPVAWRRYSAWMRLARRPAYTIDELKRRFSSDTVKVPTSTIF